jgi:hypothetical protein
VASGRRQQTGPCNYHRRHAQRCLESTCKGAAHWRSLFSSDERDTGHGVCITRRPGNFATGCCEKCILNPRQKHFRHRKKTGFIRDVRLPLRPGRNAANGRFAASHLARLLAYPAKAAETISFSGTCWSASWSGSTVAPAMIRRLESTKSCGALTASTASNRDSPSR